MGTIASLGVSITARIKGLQKGLRRGSKMIGGFASDVASASKRLAALGGGLTAIAAGGGLALITKQAFDSIDAITKTSDKLGIATEKLVGLRHAAELSGVGASTLEMGLQRMTRRIADAALGSGEATKALKELGLDAQALSRMTPDQQFYAIADAMEGVTTQSDRVRLAFKLFDSEGVNLVNTMAGGSEALEAVQADAEKLGITFSRVDAAKIEAANDAVKRMQAMFQGAAQTLAIELAPYVTAVSDYLVEMGTSGGMMGRIVQTAFGGVVMAVAYVADGIHALKIAFKVLQVGATVAVKGIITGLRLLSEGVNWLLELVGVDLQTGFIDSLKAYETGLQMTIEELAGEANALIDEGWQHDKAREALADIARRAQASAEQVAEAKKKMAQPIPPTPPTETEVGKDAIKSMQKALDTFGMTSRQVQIYEAALKGATKAEIAQLRAIDDILSAMEARQALMEEGQRVFEATRLPAEQYEAQLKRLRELYDANAIDAQTYIRAMKQAREQYTQPDIEQTVGAAVRGTVEGFSASRRRENKQEDHLSKIEKMETAAAKADDERNKHLRAISENIKTTVQPKVVDFL